MDINLGSLVGGGGTGFLVALGTFFGFHKRLNSHKEALKILGDTKVDTELCKEKHKIVELTYAEVKYIRERIDDMANGKRI